MEEKQLGIDNQFNIDAQAVFDQWLSSTVLPDTENYHLPRSLLDMKNYKKYFVDNESYSELKKRVTHQITKEVTPLKINSCEKYDQGQITESTQSEIPILNTKIHYLDAIFRTGLQVVAACQQLNYLVYYMAHTQTFYIIVTGTRSVEDFNVDCHCINSNFLFGKVHSGFFEMAKMIFNEIYDKIQKVIEYLEKESKRRSSHRSFSKSDRHLLSTDCKPLRIVIGGHSLGGAVAHVLYVLFKQYMPDFDCYAVTFGTPFCFSEGFQSVFKEYNEVLNFMNLNDPVPLSSTPYGLGFVFQLTETLSKSIKEAFQKGPQKFVEPFSEMIVYKPFGVYYQFLPASSSTSVRLLDLTKDDLDIPFWCRSNPIFVYNHLIGQYLTNCYGYLTPRALMDIEQEVEEEEKEEYMQGDEQASLERLRTRIESIHYLIGQQIEMTELNSQLNNNNSNNNTMNNSIQTNNNNSSNQNIDIDIDIDNNNNDNNNIETSIQDDSENDENIQEDDDDNDNDENNNNVNNNNEKNNENDFINEEKNVFQTISDFFVSFKDDYIDRQVKNTIDHIVRVFLKIIEKKSTK
ncbi:hypothetical protein WA158_008507 [Blastocystis sp. Blastoise]